MTARSTLLKVPNKHQAMDGGKAEPPEFTQPFIAYAPNGYGEQMVVAGDDKAICLYHGDNAWQKLPLVDGGVPFLVSHAAEREWFMAVWRLWEEWRR